MTAIQQIDGNQEGEADSMLFDPKAMTPDTPYRFNFLVHDMAVIKSQDGDMDFFYFPHSDDEAADGKTQMKPVRADENR